MENKNNTINPESNSSLNKSKWIISTLALILLVSTTFVLFGNSSKGDTDLPAYALINGEIQEAYSFATENPEALNGVNCHCGCMNIVHEGRIHSRGLLDCFKKENGEYDRHAANCAMCITDALEVKQLLQKGKTKEEIKQTIDNKYL